jgi:hypothetical protein
MARQHTYRRYWTVEDVADEVGRRASTVEKWRRSGQLVPSAYTLISNRRRWLYTGSDLNIARNLVGHRRVLDYDVYGEPIQEGDLFYDIVGGRMSLSVQGRDGLGLRRADRRAAKNRDAKRRGEPRPWPKYVRRPATPRHPMT